MKRSEKMNIIERTPELIFRLQFGDSFAAAQINLIAQSKSLIIQMLKSKDPFISTVAPILTKLNKKTEESIKRIAIQGGVAPGTSKKVKNALTQYTDVLKGRILQNKKPVTNEIITETKSSLPTNEEIKQIIQSLTQEEKERIKKALREIGVEESNLNIAAYHFHEKEIKTGWLVNAAYGILTRYDVRSAFPSPEVEKEIKKTIEKQIKENKPIHLIGFWGGYKGTESKRADMADNLAMHKIKETVEKLNKAGIDVQVTILFGDYHAASPLTGRMSTWSEMKILDYMEDISKLCDENKFELVPLSVLYGAMGIIDRPEVEKYKSKMQKPTEEDIWEGVDIAYEIVDKEEMKPIVDAAIKHASPDKIKQRGPKDIAIDYIALRIYEAKALERSFPDSIFFAYGWPISQIVPKKTLFWHSIGRLSSPPWYMEMKEGEGKDKKEENEEMKKEEKEQK